MGCVKAVDVAVLSDYQTISHIAIYVCYVTVMYHDVSPLHISIVLYNPRLLFL